MSEPPAASRDGTHGAAPTDHGKLVRDKIPQIIRADGGLPIIRIAEASEYRGVFTPASAAVAFSTAHEASGPVIGAAADRSTAPTRRARRVDTLYNLAAFSTTELAWRVDLCTLIDRYCRP